MTLYALPEPLPRTAQEATHELIERHGAFRILMIATAALLRRSPKKPALPDVYMNDRMRKDIGLAPLEPPPGLRGGYF